MDKIIASFCLLQAKVVKKMFCKPRKKNQIHLFFLKTATTYKNSQLAKLIRRKQILHFVSWQNHCLIFIIKQLAKSYGFFEKFDLYFITQKNFKKCRKVHHAVF